MYRITKMSGKFYGIELPDDNEDAMIEIADFVNQGTPVIVVYDLSDLIEMGIKDDIILAEKES